MQPWWLGLALGALAALVLAVVWLEAPDPAALAHRQGGGFVLEGVPQAPQRLANQLARYHDLTPTRLFGWDPAGNGLIVYATREGVSGLWRIQGPDDHGALLAAVDPAQAGARLNPNPQRFVMLFLQDDGGNEQFQIYGLDMRQGRTFLVSDGRSHHSNVRWSTRGDRFAFNSDRRNGYDWDLYVGTLDDPENAQPAIQGGGIWVPLAWSPDDRLIVAHDLNDHHIAYHLVDLASGVRIPLEAIRPAMDPGPVVWTRDVAGFYFVANRTGEFRGLYHYELKSETVTPLSAGLDWDVQQLALSPDETTLALTVNEEGHSRLYLLDTQTHALLPGPTLPLGQVQELAFAPQAPLLALELNTSRNPGEILVLDLESGALRTWGGPPRVLERAVEPTLIHYPTFDDVDGAPRQISAYLYAPPRGRGPHPVLVYLHGGPAAQFVPGFWPMFQYLSNELGIAVLAPNVRGSSGYGRPYAALDNTYRRLDPVKDVGALLDWVQTQPDLDPARVAVMGESYGGFLALVALATYPGQLRAGVDVAGMTNLVSFLESHSGFSKQVLEVEFGSPQREAERRFLEDISPLAHVGHIIQPLLVLQGANDPRVPAAESQQLVDALRAQGGVVWFMLAQDEGHALRHPENVADFKSALAMFLEQFLLNAR